MADTEEQKSLLLQFRAVAGVSDGRARFYLESASWNLDMALASFFDNGDDDGSIEVEEEMSIDPTPPPRPAAVPERQPVKPAATAKPSTSQSSRIATIGSLRVQDSDSSGEEGQAYYAGGSERGGGQQIIGPSKKKKGDVDNLVSGIFQSAKEHGAEVVEDASGASAAGGYRQAAFQGRAYRLGDNETQSEMLQGLEKQPERRQVEVVLKLWRNGFSVDNGPLRDFHDPVNKKFLQDVTSGQVPTELLQQARGSTVNLNMEDHRDEEYVKPPVVIQPFSGAGHRLGCPSDPVSEANNAARAMAGTKPPPSASAGSSTASQAQTSVKVDSSQPTTNVQIRLADGSRLSATFNHTHKVSDVRQYIISSRPEYATANFVLMTTFPNAELTDETLTLVAAKILNSVVVQRVK